MEVEQPQSFNERLSQWIASQGFWFQVRYSLSGGGGWSMAMYHLMRIALRILILVVIAAVAFGFYLVKRVESSEFKQGLGDRMALALGATESEMVGFQRVGGQASIRRIGIDGGPDSFFRSLEAGNLVFSMGFLDGFAGIWEAGVIHGNYLDVELRPGGGSGEVGGGKQSPLFHESKFFQLDGLNFEKARISWGYGQRFGEIVDSKMRATQVRDGWRITFNGGWFTQNWLKNFEIDELVVLVTREGMYIETGLLKDAAGFVDLVGVEITGGAEPKVQGKVILRHVEISRLLPVVLQKDVSGTMSGELIIGGSTTLSEGITLEGVIELEGSDSIIVRNGFHVLEALDVVDVFNSYKRVVLDAGSFRIKTGSGRLELSGIDLESRDLMTMRGRMVVRRPTDTELRSIFGDDAVEFFGPSGLPTVPEVDRPEITLKNAAAARENDEQSETSQFFAELGENRRLRREQAERIRNTLIFDGGVRIMIPGDSFERSRALRERFPVDQETGRIGIDVPLEGELEKLTINLAQELLRLGSNRD